MLPKQAWPTILIELIVEFSFICFVFRPTDVHSFEQFLIIMSTTATATAKMSSPQPTSPTAPQIRTTTTEQTGIHYSTIYLHTVPGTLKAVCLVWISINYLSLWFINVFLDFNFSIRIRSNSSTKAKTKLQIFLFSTDLHVDWFHFGAMQPAQRNRNSSIFQYDSNDRILVQLVVARSLFVPCDLCVP